MFVRTQVSIIIANKCKLKKS